MCNSQLRILEGVSLEDQLVELLGLCDEVRIADEGSFKTVTVVKFNYDHDDPKTWRLRSAGTTVQEAAYRAITQVKALEKRPDEIGSKTFPRVALGERCTKCKAIKGPTLGCMCADRGE